MGGGCIECGHYAKNKGFVTRYKNILTSEGAGMIELPGNLKDILVCEDVSLSFKENRYYVTERQEIIAKNIFRLAKVSGKLMELMIPYKNATLLYGPPGTGKTMFGKYIAYKMGLPFCYLNFSKVVDSYMGVILFYLLMKQNTILRILENMVGCGLGIWKKMNLLSTVIWQEQDSLESRQKQ